MLGKEWGGRGAADVSLKENHRPNDPDDSELKKEVFWRGGGGMGIWSGWERGTSCTPPI